MRRRAALPACLLSMLKVVRMFVLSHVCLSVCLYRFALCLPASASESWSCDFDPLTPLDIGHWPCDLRFTGLSVKLAQEDDMRWTPNCVSLVFQ